MTQVQLGNSFFQSGGKTVLGGAGGSGFDTQALIKGLTDAKRLPATKLEDKIKLNDKKVAALAELKTLIGKFKDSVNFLRNPPGVANAADNVFRFTTSTLSSNTAVAASTYLSVSTSPGASLQNYTVSEITALARAKKQTTGTFAIANADTAVVSDTPAAGQFKSGTFTLKGKSITFTAGDTLNAVASKLNAVSGDTGIIASVIKVADNSYTLSFAATKTGTAADFDFNNVDVPATLVDSGDVFDLVTVSTQSIAGTLQTAQDSQFKLNGATITRASNTVTDVVDGVTFNLLQTTPVGLPVTTIDVSVKPDETLVKNGIVNFANTYNELKQFVAKQTEVKDDGTFADTAVLSGSTSMRSTINAVTSQLSSIISGLSGSFTRLGDIGFSSADLPASDDSPKVRNIISIDEGKLTSAISANFDAVRKLFEYNFNASNPNLSIFSRTNAPGNASSFTLTINPYATQSTKELEVADALTDIVSATPTTNQFKAGTVTINGQAITLIAGDTLTSIAQKFNDVSATTGVSAAVEQVSAGKFKLNFTTTVINGVNQNLRAGAIDPTDVFGNVALTSTASYKATYTTASGPVTKDVDGAIVKDSSGVSTGISLTGQAGTGLEGLVMVYTGISAATVTVTATQGVADQIYNTTDSVLKQDTGLLDTEIQAFKDSDTKLNDDIARIDAQVELFRKQLLDKFSVLEQVISRVNSLLTSIDANNSARNNSGN